MYGRQRLPGAQQFPTKICKSQDKRQLTDAYPISVRK